MSTYGEIIADIPTPDDYTERAAESLREAAANVLEALIDKIEDQGCARAIVPPIVPDKVVELVKAPLIKKGWDVKVEKIENGGRLLTIDPPAAKTAKRS
jgi:hypothetical protein